MSDKEKEVVEPRCPYKLLNRGIGLNDEVTEIRIQCKLNNAVKETYKLKWVKE